MQSHKGKIVKRLLEQQIEAQVEYPPWVDVCQGVLFRADVQMLALVQFQLQTDVERLA